MKVATGRLVKTGDVSRRRRLMDGQAKLSYYARHRAQRFARRMFGAGK